VDPSAKKHIKNFDVFSEMDFDKSKEYFHIMPHEEPHTARRRAILAKHPEILNLYVKDITSAYITIAAIVFQLTTAYFF